MTFFSISTWLLKILTRSYTICFIISDGLRNLGKYVVFIYDRFIIIASKVTWINRTWPKFTPPEQTIFLNTAISLTSIFQCLKTDRHHTLEWKFNLFHFTLKCQKNSKHMSLIYNHEASYEDLQLSNRGSLTMHTIWSEIDLAINITELESNVFQQSFFSRKQHLTILI